MRSCHASANVSRFVCCCFNVYSTTQSVWGLFFCLCILCNGVSGTNKHTSLANLLNESVMKAFSVLIPRGWRFKHCFECLPLHHHFVFFYHSCNLFSKILTVFIVFRVPCSIFHYLPPHCIALTLFINLCTKTVQLCPVFAWAELMNMLDC